MSACVRVRCARARMWVCVRKCAVARVRACVRACVRVLQRACVRACVRALQRACARARVRAPIRIACPPSESAGQPPPAASARPERLGRARMAKPRSVRARRASACMVGQDPCEDRGGWGSSWDWGGGRGGSTDPLVGAGDLVRLRLDGLLHLRNGAGGGAGAGAGVVHSHAAGWEGMMAVHWPAPKRSRKGAPPRRRRCGG